MAIVLDLVTKPNEAALRSSSTLIEKHFAVSGMKAGEDFSKALATGIEKSPAVAKQVDKLADLTGRLRVEQEKLNSVNAKGNATEAQKIAQAERVEKVQRDIIRSTRETARAYEVANTSAGGFITTLANLSAGTRFGGVISSADTLAAKFGGVGLAAGGAIAGVAGLGVAAVAVGKQFYDMGAMWDNVSDNITAKTGKIGDELKSITDQVAAVSTTTAATQEELGNIAGSAVSSLRLSGSALGDMVKQIADLNKLTGEETNIRGLGLIFRMFRVEGEKQVPFLNELYSTFQRTGIPVNDLIATLDKGGTVLSGFGMSATQAAATISLFEEAGVPADQALRGLTFAFKQLNGAGKDPIQGLRDMVTQIKALHDAGNDLGAGGARDLAEQYFGKGFGPILQSIIDSRFELDKLPTSMGGVKNSIDDATKSTEDFAEHWQKFKNQMAVELKPVTESFFSWMNAQLDSALELTKKFTSAWNEWGQADWWKNSAAYKALQSLGIVGGNTGAGGGGSSWGGSDQDLLSHVQAGKYVSQPGVGDLSQGLGDCTSAIEDLVDIMNGQPTAGRSLSTSNAPQWLIEHGFIPTNDLVPGSLNVGFNDHHMQATLPGGTNFNWGSDSAAAAKGMAGGGAFDPTQGFTQHYYLPSGGGIVIPTPGGNQYPTGASQREHRGLAPAAGSATPGLAPVGPATEPTPQTPVSPSTADFPAADQVGPANATTSPVQMIPSPFGPQYAPVPAGSTPGYDQFGKPGTYLSDPNRVKSATTRYQNALDNINEANDAISEAKRRQVEIENDLTADSQKRADAAKEVAKAEKRRNELIDQAQTAEDDLAQAKLGTFREAQKAAQQKAQAGSTGGFSQLADDFGLGEGLPGLAKWLTTFAGNMAIAPMVGQLSAISAANPIKGGSGLLGIMGAQNIAAGRSPLGLSSGADFMPGAGSVVGPGTTTSDSIPAMLSNGEYVLPADAVSSMGGPGGVDQLVRGYAAGGPVDQTQMPTVPQATTGGGGFQGVGGLPMQAIMGATAGLDLLAPGASQAAQIGIQLANRTIAYGGQLAAIGVGGLMETFLPHGSAVGDPGKSWLGKLASGFSGARPALPNAAGQLTDPAKNATPGMGGPQGPQPPAAVGQPAPPQTPEQAAALQQNGQVTQPNAPMVQIDKIVNNTPDSGRSLAQQISYHQMISNARGAGPVLAGAMLI
jgi:hypothetical protein